MLTFLFGLCIGAAAAGLVARVFNRAPAGYEDAEGFHAGNEPGNEPSYCDRCGKSVNKCVCQSHY